MGEIVVENNGRSDERSQNLERMAANNGRIDND